MDVLVDLSEPKVSPKKNTTTRKSHMSMKENQHNPKLIKPSCATGILIDFSHPDCQPLGERDVPVNMADDQSVASDYSKTPDKSNLSQSRLIYLEGSGFDISPQPTAMSSVGHSKNVGNSYLALGSLNAHQMAEIFEQANTIAVRIELASARQHTCSTNASGTEASPSVGEKENNQLSPEGFITDESLMVATSTPTNKVVPDVNVHFLGAVSEKSFCLETNEKLPVSGQQPTTKKQIRLVGRTISMKQPSTNTNQGKTLIGQRTANAGGTGSHASATTSLAPKMSASSSASDSNVPPKAQKSRVSMLRPCGSTQPKNDADHTAAEVLTRSLDTPSVATHRPSMRQPMESMKSLEERKKALVLKPCRNLLEKPLGRLRKKEIVVERGTDPPHLPGNKLQRKQSISKKVGNQITAAEQSGNKGKKL